MLETRMRSPEELIAEARKATEVDEYISIMDVLQEALSHLSDFSWKSGETWDMETVHSCCHEIGDLIYEDIGFRGMRFVHDGIYYRMRGIAANYLDHFWNGCGNGAWRG